MEQTLFITGSTGIAEATARMWPAEDRVFVFGQDEPSCRELAESLPNAWYFVGDVRDEEAVSNAVRVCGRVDSVFNVAGISARRFGDGPLHECTAEGWDTAIDVN